MCCPKGLQINNLPQFIRRQNRMESQILLYLLYIYLFCPVFFYKRKFILVQLIFKIKTQNYAKFIHDAMCRFFSHRLACMKEIRSRNEHEKHMHMCSYI